MMKIGKLISAKFQKYLGSIYIECYVIIVNDDVYDIIFLLLFYCQESDKPLHH